MSGDSILAAAVVAFGTSDGTEEQGESVLRAGMEIVGASHGVVYFLDWQGGMLRPEISLGSGRSHAPLAAGEVDVPDGNIGPASCLGHSIESDPTSVPTGIAVYASRDDVCVAIMRLEGVPSPALDKPGLDSLMSLASLLMMSREQRLVQNFVSAMSLPISLVGSDQEFFDSLAEFAMTATGAGRVLLRQRTGDQLRCVGAGGLRPGDDLRQWDVSPINDHPLLSRVLSGETILVSAADVNSNQESPHLYPEDALVLAPIRMAAQYWGALSFDLKEASRPTRGQLDGFDGVASMVGLSLAARSSRDAVSERLRAQSALARLTTEIEISRSVRHEIKNHLGNCQVVLHGLHRRLRDTDLAESVEDISQQLVRVNRAFDSPVFDRMSTERQDMSLERVSLKRIWSQALTALEGQLGSQKIEARYVGPDVTVPMLPNHMRHALLNLLLNSIDAFRNTKRRGRRSVELHVRDPAARARDLSVVFSDTAGGIDRSALVVPAPLRDKPLEQLIFEPGVTSKPHGTGFGLWLVRRILGEHHGSIDLLSHRGGVAFAIQLPRSAN